MNIHNEVKKICPKKSDVYFNQLESKITVILDSDIGEDKRWSLQQKILSFIGSRMLHYTYRTVSIMW